MPPLPSTCKCKQVENSVGQGMHTRQPTTVRTWCATDLAGTASVTLQLSHQVPWHKSSWPRVRTAQRNKARHEGAPEQTNHTFHAQPIHAELASFIDVHKPRLKRQRVSTTEHHIDCFGQQQCEVQKVARSAGNNVDRNWSTIHCQ